MTSNERRQKILEIVTRNKSVQIIELTELFGVSVMTLRRDLQELEEKKYIKRTYGGAVLNEEELNKPYFPRAAINSVAKNLIARRASELIKDDETVILDLGTTVLALSRYLDGKKDLSVITCSVPVMNEIEKYPDVTLFALGGTLRRDNHAFLDESTEQQLASFCADIAFIGVAGISFEYGLTNFYRQTAGFCKKIMRQAKRVVLLADSSKFGKAKSAIVGSLSDIDTIITDDGIPADYKAEFERLGVEVIIAKTVNNDQV